MLRNPDSDSYYRPEGRSSGFHAGGEDSNEAPSGKSNHIFGEAP
jgi:hypothetical protein